MFLFEWFRAVFARLFSVFFGDIWFLNFCCFNSWPLWDRTKTEGTLWFVTHTHRRPLHVVELGCWWVWWALPVALLAGVCTSRFPQSPPINSKFEGKGSQIRFMVSIALWRISTYPLPCTVHTHTHVHTATGTGKAFVNRNHRVLLIWGLQRKGVARPSVLSPLIWYTRLSMVVVVIIIHHFYCVDRNNTAAHHAERSTTSFVLGRVSLCVCGFWMKNQTKPHKPQPHTTIASLIKYRWKTARYPPGCIGEVMGPSPYRRHHPIVGSETFGFPWRGEEGMINFRSPVLMAMMMMMMPLIYHSKKKRFGFKGAKFYWKSLTGGRRQVPALKGTQAHLLAE